MAILKYNLPFTNSTTYDTCGDTTFVNVGNPVIKDTSSFLDYKGEKSIQKALYLDGSSYVYNTITDPTSKFAVGNLTVSFWFYIQELTSESMTLFNFGYESFVKTLGLPDPVILIYIKGSDPTNKRIGIAGSVANILNQSYSTSSSDIFDNVNIFIGKWNFIIAAYNESTQTLELYINNKLQQSVTDLSFKGFYKNLYLIFGNYSVLKLYNQSINVYISDFKFYNSYVPQEIVSPKVVTPTISLDEDTESNGDSTSNTLDNGSDVGDPNFEAKQKCLTFVMDPKLYNLKEIIDK